MSLTETAVTGPYVKDYDTIEGAGPQCWPGRFDVSNWGLIGARRDGASVGGAVIASRTPGLHMPGGRDDVAVLWDIRVSPRERGGASGPRCSGPPGTGLKPAAAGGSRSRLRTSTCRPAVSTRRWAARWAPSTGSRIPASQPRCNCCGGRRWNRLTRNPADPISALTTSCCVRFPAGRQIGDHPGCPQSLCRHADCEAEPVEALVTGHYWLPA
jgi:hypothetical protein